jgi:DNA-binding winged helix-turn-helix (wHTH) protein/predicted ATPase
MFRTPAGHVWHPRLGHRHLHHKGPVGRKPGLGQPVSLHLSFSPALDYAAPAWRPGEDVSSAGWPKSSESSQISLRFLSDAVGHEVQQKQVVSFGPYQFEPHNAQLRRGKRVLPLTRKACEVLQYLVAHSGQLVTKDALFQAVWPETVVSEGVLTNCIAELRQALGDDAKRPRCIATVHRRGYRFLAPLHPQAPTPSPASQAPDLASAPAPSPLAADQPVSHPAPLPLVGREAELAHLHRLYMDTLHGQRRVVFVTGEAGIGKTALVETFVRGLSHELGLWIGHGQCIEQYGAGEAYLPLLEALGRLCRGPRGERLVALLVQYAPSWVVQLPALLSASALADLQHTLVGTTRARMLRELSVALDVVSAVHPLVLVLEDLHWSDPSTVEALAMLARRREPARLLVVSTYRAAEAVVRDHSLTTVKHELLARGQGVEVALSYLSPAAVHAYVAARIKDQGAAAALAPVVSRRTDGHPFFMVQVTDSLMQAGEPLLATPAALVALEQALPQGLRELIEAQLGRLTAEEQQVLEVGSVAGMEFAVASVAAGFQRSDVTIEAVCARLARRGQFLEERELETWPDGTVSGRYGFRHALYQDVLYQRLGRGWQARLHRQIGEWQEQAYGERAREVAAELAVHFERGRDYQRAVQYLQQAAENAARRNAHHEVIALVTKGLELLATLPETPARAQQELDFQLALGPALIATKGSAAPEVEQIYTRAQALCAQVGDTPQLFPALRGLWHFYFNRGALPMAWELGEQLLRLAQRTADPTHRLEAPYALGSTLFYLGDYAAARTQCEQGIARIDPTALPAQALYQGTAPGVGCLVIAAHTLWCLGYPAQALRRGQEALARARVLAHPYSLALAQYYAARLHHRRRDVPAVQAQAETMLTLATAQGFPLWAELGTFWQGWALAMQGEGGAGLARMHQSMAAILAIGVTLVRPVCLVLLAEAMGHTGQVAEGLRLLAEALAMFEASGHGDLLAEAYRLQGVLLLQQAVPETAQAEACFQQALTIARRQQAQSWELRAAMSLARLWQCQGKRSTAYELLAPIYHWFTEGFDTADLQEAQALLEELS